MSSASHKTRIRTLRARLTLWYLAILTLTLALFAGLLYLFLAQSLYRHHDEELAEEARGLAELLRGAQPNQPAVVTRLDRQNVTAQFVMVRDLRGEMLYGSPSLEAIEPGIGRHEALVHAAARGDGAPQFFIVQLDRSGPARFICVPLGQPPAAFLQVGSLLGDVAPTLHRVGVVSVVLIPVVLVLTSFGGWFIARRALSPIDAINDTVTAIQATDLARRIDVHPADEELSRLVRTLNQLLDRLERAFATLRSFAADTSHQLQTPLTVVRGTLEVALSQPREADAYRQVLRDVAEEVDDMSAVIADLRALSLADAGLPARAEGPVDLSETCREAADIIHALGEAKHVTVESEIAPGVRVWGDAIRLKQVLLNLGDNAIKYTPAGGRVTIQLVQEAGQGVLRVSDTGAGIAGEHLRRIFDRFYRAHSSRSGVGGTGLGLAIVKAIVDAHGGAVAAKSQPHEGSCFTVRLPLAS